MISDNLNNLSSFKYDHRNLITEFRKVTETPTDPPSYEIRLTEMKYDDMGMRIRKTEYLYTGYESDPVFNEDAPIGWTAISDIYYVRDFSGKEIAIYNSYDIKQWNLYGFENEGYLDADRQVRIYIKDHLGSIRVTLDDKLAVINAQDGVYPDLSGICGDICCKIKLMNLRIQHLNSQARREIKKVDMIILYQEIIIQKLEDFSRKNQ
ncbi:MAG TPA: hypothetical protein DIS94_12035 [Bacteroidetes bacterium]|nr:hypothetical protein [Bacteroidota bacterium]